MPAYVLICEKCDLPVKGEVILKIAERDLMRCETCGGKLMNDYSRMETSNFSLKGSNWPGKMVQIENKIMKERNDV